MFGQRGMVVFVGKLCMRMEWECADDVKIYVASLRQSGNCSFRIGSFEPTECASVGINSVAYRVCCSRAL